MVLVYLQNEECVEIPDAVRVEKESGQLWCISALGRVVRTFQLEDVAVYTTDPDTAEIVKEEVCEEDAPVAAS